MTGSAEICPRCAAPMVLRTAGRGQFIGKQFWGCSTFPACRARVEIANEAAMPAPTAVAVAAVPDVAGGSAQAEFEKRRQRRAERVRRVLPQFIAMALVTVVLAFVVAQAIWGPTVGALAAGAVALLFAITYFERPQTIESWRIGAEGERRTADYIDRLANEGFVVLHDRKAPGYGGNLDHIAIGPTGVWAIETKSLAGKVVIRGDSLRIGGRRQDRIIDQVFREAAAVQNALRETLGAAGVTVTPVICLHRGELPFFNKSVRGVRLASGRQLVRLLKDGNAKLDAEAVQRLADTASRLLPKAAKDA